MPYTIPDSIPFALNGDHLTDGCTIDVRVQPRASRNSVAGFRDGTLRVSVTAPPHDGQANAALLELLSETLKVGKSRLHIVRGHSSRDKVVTVAGLTQAEVERRVGSM